MEVFKAIAKTNREGMFIASLPFYFGFVTAVTGGYASIPLVFDLTWWAWWETVELAPSAWANYTLWFGNIMLTTNCLSVEWFNENFVTADMPDEKDLETWLEVGSASWGWMEPVLGQVSFFLLCMQFARSQMKNLGIRPYYNWQRERRATYLVQKYPRYDH